MEDKVVMEAILKEVTILSSMGNRESHWHLASESPSNDNRLDSLWYEQKTKAKPLLGELLHLKPRGDTALVSGHLTMSC